MIAMAAGPGLIRVKPEHPEEYVAIADTFRTTGCTGKVAEIQAFKMEYYSWAANSQSINGPPSRRYRRGAMP